MSDAEKKRLEAKHQAIINELLKHPDNRVCADCGEKGTLTRRERGGRESASAREERARGGVDLAGDGKRA